MTLETYLAEINQNIFYKEFSFSRNQFTPPLASEVEFADHVVWLDDLFITFQLKERNASGHHTVEGEVKWFEKTVVGKGTKQIRDTLHYLSSYEEINITNEKGHVFNVGKAKLNKPINVVSYTPLDLLPSQYKSRKFHISATAGFIHLIPIGDWVGICQSLITPAEIREYLEFRQQVSMKYEDQANNLPEQALMGQFMIGSPAATPNIGFARYVAIINQASNEFDLSHILRIFGERIVKIIEASPRLGAYEQYQYYQILKELAKLNRNELREIKFRYDLCIEKCRIDEFVLPYRVTFPRTGCGFVFIVVTAEDIPKTVTALKNFTYAHKYDQRLNKCVGISFSRDGEFYDVGWCYLEEEWVHDGEMERNLKERFPFRPVTEEFKPRYRFGKGAAER